MDYHVDYYEDDCESLYFDWPTEFIWASEVLKNILRSGLQGPQCNHTALRNVT